MTDDLLARVEAALKATGIAPSRFGFDAIGERQFVKQLREGREPRSKTRNRVIAHIDLIMSSHTQAPTVEPTGGGVADQT